MLFNKGVKKKYGTLIELYKLNIRNHEKDHFNYTICRLWCR